MSNQIQTTLKFQGKKQDGLHNGLTIWTTNVRRGKLDISVGSQGLTSNINRSTL